MEEMKTACLRDSLFGIYDLYLLCTFNRRRGYSSILFVRTNIIMMHYGMHKKNEKKAVSFRIRHKIFLYGFPRLHGTRVKNSLII